MLVEHHFLNTNIYVDLLYCTHTVRLLGCALLVLFAAWHHHPSTGQLKCDDTRTETDFVLRRNGGVHLNRRGRQFNRLLAAEVCASAVVMLDGYTMFRGSVKGTGYPLH